jgi:copper homeostasis protein
MTASLEIACFDLPSAIIAADAGADRIEFATDYTSGGVTPDLLDFEKIRSHTGIPIFVLIRCRPGDFCYSNKEIEDMIASILEFKKSGADGFVFGCLNEDLHLDLQANKLLLEAGAGKSSTFHRAFDRCVDQKKALEQIIHLGFENILTSGGQSNAIDGIPMLRDLLQQSANRIRIMPGGGIRSGNIKTLMNELKSDWYHTAAIREHGNQADAMEIKCILDILQN